MRSEAPNVIPFPLSHKDRLRIATYRLALAMEAQARALAGLRSFLAPPEARAPANRATFNKG